MLLSPLPPRRLPAHPHQIYASINNGVYRSGFATSQAAYDAVQDELWAAMDEMERRLSSSRFLLGDRCGGWGAGAEAAAGWTSR